MDRSDELLGHRPRFYARRTEWLFGCALLAWAAPSHAQGQGFTLPSEVQVHGFVSQGFIKTSDNNYLAESERGSVEFTEVGLNFTLPLSEDLRVGMQLFARDLGPFGNFQARFDWFYLDYRFRDWLGLRAGRTKLPFGLYNETSDIDAARVPVLLPQSMYPTTNREYLLAQTGAELYGLVPLGPAGQLEYRLYGGTIFFQPEDASPQIGDVSVPYIGGGRLMWLSPLQGLQVGGSAQALRIDIDYVPSAEERAGLEMAGLLPEDFSGTVEAKVPVAMAVGSVEYAAQEWLIAAEYSRWWASLESTLPALLPATKVTNERAYVMTSYQVASWFWPGAYYSVLFADVHDRQRPGAFQHDVALTLRYDINQHWLVKLEGHYMHGTAGLSSALNDMQPLSELKEDWGVFLAKTTAHF
ncbi:MAG TPA: hypothetical protein VI197_06305 [Polyangiaceae bacterium]